MKEKSYQLNRYKIIEKGNGKLQWEVPDGLVVESGKCFIEGNILLISDRGTQRQHGININDFKENLTKLPKWEKTKYHCPFFSLYSCKTGRRVSR